MIERHPDNPLHKETIASQLFGEFVGFVKSQGLTKGKEFETQITEIFQCSKKLLWIDRYHPKFQITVYLNSIQMSVEFGVVIKKTKEVIHRNKLEDLRYKISPNTQLELIDPHQKNFDDLFNDFKLQFLELTKK